MIVYWTLGLIFLIGDVTSLPSDIGKKKMTIKPIVQKRQMEMDHGVTTTPAPTTFDFAAFMNFTTPHTTVVFDGLDYADLHDDIFVSVDRNRHNRAFCHREFIRCVLAEPYFARVCTKLLDPQAAARPQWHYSICHMDLENCKWAVKDHNGYFDAVKNGFEPHNNSVVMTGNSIDGSCVDERALSIFEMLFGTDRLVSDEVAGK